MKFYRCSQLHINRAIPVKLMECGPAYPTLWSGALFFIKRGLMLDIKRIRTDFDAVAEKLATRGVDAAVLNDMKEIDAKRRDILVKVENPQSRT